MCNSSGGVHGAAVARLLIMALPLSFLCLVPDEAKSSYHVEGTGYDTYLRDAHRQVSDVADWLGGKRTCMRHPPCALLCPVASDPDVEEHVGSPEK